MKLFVILVLALPSSAFAQLNIGFKASGAWTDVDELDRGYGVELSATNYVTRRIGWSLTYSGHWNNADGFGSACTGLVPPGADCSARPLEVERSLEFFSILVMLRAINSSNWTLDVGAGPAKHKFDYEEREPDTGRRGGAESNSWFQGTFQNVSIAGTAVLTRNKLFDRFGVQLSMSRQMGEMRTCVIDGPALCGDYNATKASLGVNYQLR